jgi:hypothetical protein
VNVVLRYQCANLSYRELSLASRDDFHSLTVQGEHQSCKPRYCGTAKSTMYAPYLIGTNLRSAAPSRIARVL